MFCVKKYVSNLNIHATKVFRRNFKSVYDPVELYKNPEVLETTSTPAPVPVRPDNDKFNGFIPVDKLKISYSTSTGPGGQNVNKILTRAEVKFHVKSADWIPHKTREKFFEKYSYRISNDGYFVVRSERTRSQNFNLADCMDKLRFSIRQCEEDLEKIREPTEQEKEVLKKRQLAAARRVLQQKRLKAQNKKDYNLE